MKVFEKIKIQFKKLNLRRENVIAFIITTGLAIIFLVDNNYLHNTVLGILLIVSLILFLASLTVVFAFAGKIVIQALFDVSVGLSLLIFLGQSYCGPSVIRTDMGNSALKLLVLFGLGYVAYDFYSKMKKAIKDYREKLKLNELKKEEKIFYFITATFFVFVVAFIIFVYQIISPIILGLCIYKQ